MSSDVPRRSIAILALGVLALSTLLACGRKGDPQPPPRKHPARTNDLRVAQRGHELILTMSYPTMTVGRLALPGIDRLDLVQYVRAAPEFMTQPEGEATDAEATEAPKESSEDVKETPATGADATPAPAPSVSTEPTVEPAQREAEAGAGAWAEPGQQDSDVFGTLPSEPQAEGQTEDAETPLEPTQADEPAPNPYLSIRLDTKEFDKKAETVLRLEGEELDSAVVGGKIVMRLPLAEIAVEPPQAYSFAVETFAGRLRSPQSRPVSFVPLPPPAPPLNPTAAIEAEGIRLTWQPAGDDVAIEGYRILRRLPQSSGFLEGLASVKADVHEYLDTSARFGDSYVYSVTAVLMARPLVESSLSEEASISYRDTFAPEPPQGLVALAEAGRTRLLWDPNRERDIVGYLAFVRAGDGEAQRLTDEPIDATELVHEGTVSGISYTYWLRAVDSAGNQSEPSAEVTTSAP